MARHGNILSLKKPLPAKVVLISASSSAEKQKNIYEKEPTKCIPADNIFE